MMRLAGRKTVAVTNLPPRAQGAGSGGAPTSEELRSFGPVIRLIGGIWSISSVCKIGASFNPGVFEVWVFIREANLEEEARIAAFERQYRNSGLSFPFDLHVIPLDHVEEGALPPIDIVLDR